MHVLLVLLGAVLEPAHDRRSAAAPLCSAASGPRQTLPALPCAATLLQSALSKKTCVSTMYPLPARPGCLLPPAGACMHLRTLLLLKCVSFALGALQLRSGYPPPASFSNGMGRHTFWFMRHVSTPHAVAFQAFMVTQGGCVYVSAMWQACRGACGPTPHSLGVTSLMVPRPQALPLPLPSSNALN